MHHWQLDDVRILAIVPAGGLGSRLRPLTDRRAKPGLAIGFDQSGYVQRMIDLPLGVLRDVGGEAVVIRAFASKTLDFVQANPNIQFVEGSLSYTVLDTIVQNKNLIQSSPAEFIALLPGDACLSNSVFKELLAVIKNSRLNAVMLATKKLSGHNLHYVSAGGVLTTSYDAANKLADLGVHIFARKWLLERLQRLDGRTGLDIWSDLYTETTPPPGILLHVPNPDFGWVDLGTPLAFYKFVTQLNKARQDARGNIVFPGATIHPASRGVVALPTSQSSNVLLEYAVVPENTIVKNRADVLEITL